MNLIIKDNFQISLLPEEILNFWGDNWIHNKTDNVTYYYRIKNLNDHKWLGSYDGDTKMWTFSIDNEIYSLEQYLRIIKLAAYL